jgi:Bacteriophage HK97-gp10, putative tail-component
MADMKIEIVTEIEGLDELEKAFTSGAKKAVKKFLRSVEFKAAKLLVDSAEKYAPYEAGFLAGDIHRQTVADDGALTVRVGPSRSSFYGMIQEFGSPEANVPALHWLENSAVAVQDKVLDRYMEALTEALEEMKG